MNSLEPLKIIEISKDDINSFVSITEKTILSEKLKEKNNLIEQLIGHIKQLIVRANNILSKEKLDIIVKDLDEYNEQFLLLKSSQDLNKLQELDNLYQKIFTIYSDLKKDVITIINNTNITEYNNLITKLNQKLEEIKNKPITLADEKNLIALYNNIKNNIDSLTNLKEILTLIDKILVKPNLDKSKGDTLNRKFSLFAKINDQIIASSFKVNNNLIYACYTLEDYSKYYAIIKSEEEINIIDQSFTNLPNLVLTKDNIINTCKMIIDNAAIYYNINEYMRYIEKSYKNKMTKEIDEVILKYKKRLTILEECIKKQLEFIDDIALIVNNKKSAKYPNIIYNDTKIKDCFKDYDKNMDSKTKEVERLIVEVLLNDEIKSSFDTKDILKTLYDEEILTDLVTSEYKDNEERPTVNTDDNLIREIPINKVTTNYEKMNNYLKSRVEELNLLINSSKINVTITKEDDFIYKDINTVLDLHTAIIICDKVYKKGQGFYAFTDYLKTGNTLKFTSKFGARDLVNTINKSNYIKLLLENIIKRYVYTNNKELKDFITLIITKENIEEIIDILLENNQVLKEALENYDYDYLDNSSAKNIKVNEILTNSNNANINDLLGKIKKLQ